MPAQQSGENDVMAAYPRDDVRFGRPWHATGRAFSVDGVTPRGRAVSGVPDGDGRHLVAVAVRVRTSLLGGAAGLGARRRPAVPAIGPGRGARPLPGHPPA